MGFLNKTPKCLALYALGTELFPEFLLIFPELRNTLPFAEEENLKFFMLFPSPQFQRRFSSPCAVKNKNSMVTVR